MGPVVQQVVGVLGPLEVDDASKPVHFSIDGLVDHQIGQKLLRLLRDKEIPKLTLYGRGHNTGWSSPIQTWMT